MIRSRIAPTPSGYLHTGNAVNFAITWLWVRRQNGRLKLRIDDLDAPRVRPEYLQDIFTTLEWLGIDWDEGPQTPDEHNLLYSQLLRIPRYHQLLQQLIQTQQVFACSCSRKEIQQQGADQIPGTCLHKAIPIQQPDTSLRIMTPEGTTVTVNDAVRGKMDIDLYNHLRHFVIQRRDGLPAYQVASLADDMDDGINLIIRGHDLLHSTAAQLYLASLTDNTVFAKTTFYHHQLLKDEQGNKLSKSAGSLSINHWRQNNIKPEEFYLMLGKRLGLSEPAVSAEEMLGLVKDTRPVIV